MTLKLPAGVLAQHAIALGKTGSGKSSSLRVLVEGLLDADKPVCIIDPKGDWWGIKSSADGKHAGYPIVIFGGEHADVPINEHSAAAVAELIGTGNRSCLIDLGGWMVGERTRFFVAFAAALFKTTKGARHLVIDEVHNFAPQGKILDPDAGKMLHWANRLASEGRGKGITILAASQRPQKVHKDFVTSCETLIAKKVIHKLDREAVRDWIDGCADPAKGREVIATLAGLKKPQAWVWSPEIDYGPVLVEFPMFKTFDSFKPQEADAAALKGWAQVDLEDVKAKLTTVVADAEANDPKILKKRIAELERQAKVPLAAAEIPGALRQSYYNEGFHDGQKAAIAEVQPQLDRQFDKGYRAAAAAISGIVTGVVRAGDEFMVQLRAVTAAIDRSDPEPAARAAAQVPAPMPAMPRRIVTPVRTPVNTGAKTRSPLNGDSPTGARRRIMIALAQNIDGLTSRKLGILSGVKEGGSTWRAAFAQLRKDNHIIEGGGLIGLNDAGQRSLGDYEPLPTGEALLEYWRSQFSSTRLAVFNAILDGGGHAVPATRVAAIAGVELGGSTWRAHMAHLRGLELVSGSEQLQASEDLFS